MGFFNAEPNATGTAYRIGRRYFVLEPYVESSVVRGVFREKRVREAALIAELAAQRYKEKFYSFIPISFTLFYTYMIFLRITENGFVGSLHWVIGFIVWGFLTVCSLFPSFTSYLGSRYIEVDRLLFDAMDDELRLDMLSGQVDEAWIDEYRENLIRERVASDLEPEMKVALDSFKRYRVVDSRG